MHFALKNFFFANSADPDEIPHYIESFILVFTVCQSTCLQVSRLKRVNPNTKKVSIKSSYQITLKVDKNWITGRVTVKTWKFEGRFF